VSKGCAHLFACYSRVSVVTVARPLGPKSYLLCSSRISRNVRTTEISKSRLASSFLFASCSPCPEPSPCRPLSSLSYSTPPSPPSSDVPRSTHLTTCGDEPFQLRRRRPQGIYLSSFSDPSTSTPTFLTTSCTITLGRSTSCPDPLSCSNVLVSRSLSRTQARPIVPYFLYHF
jgi:hypothetical protein